MDTNIGSMQLLLELEEEKRHIEESAECDWHFYNSFVQAVINPTQIIFDQHEISFKHYRNPTITYTATYSKANEWLFLIPESEHNLEEHAKYVIQTHDPLAPFNELEKFRIARAWLHKFLNDEIDSPLIVKRKSYLEAFKVGDDEKLSQIAESIACYTNSTLMEEIDQRKSLYLKE